MRGEPNRCGAESLSAQQKIQKPAKLSKEFGVLAYVGLMRVPSRSRARRSSGFSVFGPLPLLCLSALLAFACGEKAASSVEAAETVNLQSSAVISESPAAREVRATGTIQATRYLTVQTPRIAGRNSRLTLVGILPNGAVVEEGAVLAEFDQIEQLEAGRQAQARHEDLSHQVEQKRAENEAASARRRLELREAEAELEEARLQLRKGPLLSEIDRLKNEVRAAAAEERVESLGISGGHREEAEVAAFRILELQRERQQVAMERAENNLSRLVVRAPLAGMVALEATWRNGTRGHPQEGDQLYPGQVLLRIFDASEMEVEARIAESDRAVLRPDCRAVVRVDAYPDMTFTVRLKSASPVAASALGSPIKTFLAKFQLEQTDPRLLPDLSAVVVIPVDDP